MTYAGFHSNPGNYDDYFVDRGVYFDMDNFISTFKVIQEGLLPKLFPGYNMWVSHQSSDNGDMTKAALIF